MTLEEASAGVFRPNRDLRRAWSLPDGDLLIPVSVNARGRMLIFQSNLLGTTGPTDHWPHSFQLSNNGIATYLLEVT